MSEKTLSKKPYGNHKMLSINNKFLAHVDTKKMNWYLDRELAEMVNEKDFKLLFKSKGDEDRGEYYKLELKNRCVISGSEENLTKHHVVPYQFRKYFPTKYKSKSSFDVLCVSQEEHDKYEKFADEYKDNLLEKYNLKNYTRDAIRAKKAINSLENYSDYIYNERKETLINQIEKFFGESFDELMENGQIDSDFEPEPASSIIVRNLDSIEDFIISWRKHFIEYAKPKFLPEEWYDEMNTIITFNE